MKTPGCPLPSVAAALLAAFAASGCGAPRQAPGTARPGEPICIIVTYDEEKNTAVLSNKTAWVREGKDWVLWASPDGIVHVDFGQVSPFEKEPRHEKKVLKSMFPKKGTANQGFDYKAVLELTRGGRVEVDPRIEVLP